MGNILTLTLISKLSGRPFKNRKIVSELIDLKSENGSLEVGYEERARELRNSRNPNKICLGLFT